MNASSLLVATSLALFGPDTPKPARDREFAKYFDPPPYTHVEISRKSLLDKRRGEFDRTGSIEVKPPAGHCFTITRRSTLPDDVVCNPSPDGETSRHLTFNGHDIDVAGRVTWIVQTGPQDIGNEYFWQTPHRTIKVIPAGKRLTSLWVPKLLDRCERVEDRNGTVIKMNLVGGDIWRVRLPKVHSLVSPQPSPIPNLLTHESKARGGITENSEVRVEELDDYVKAKLNAPKLEDVQTYWSIPARGNYQLDGEFFVETDGPAGIQAQCRYNLRGAPKDPESGWIECHNLPSYDVMLSYLPCTKS